jgi:hypothetical protein
MQRPGDDGRREAVSALGRELAARKLPVVFPNNDEEYALSQGIYVLLRRKIIRPSGNGGFLLVPAYRDLLHYYRETIDHHVG